MPFSFSGSPEGLGGFRMGGTAGQFAAPQNISRSIGNPAPPFAQPAPPQNIFRGIGNPAPPFAQPAPAAPGLVNDFRGMGIPGLPGGGPMLDPYQGGGPNPFANYTFGGIPAHPDALRAPLDTYLHHPRG